jgi:hypothetical protein
VILVEELPPGRPCLDAFHPPLPRADAVRLAREVGATIAAVHAQGGHLWGGVRPEALYVAPATGGAWTFTGLAPRWIVFLQGEDKCSRGSWRCSRRKTRSGKRPSRPERVSYALGPYLGRINVK